MSMYKVRVHMPLLLTLFLVTLVLSPTILPARGVTSYTPGVTSGQWAEYKFSFHCAPDPAICNSFNTFPQSEDYGLLQVISVHGTQVILNIITVYQNGTGTHMGVSLDISTGYSNITTPLGPQTGQGDFFLVAAGLQAHDHLFSSGDPRTFNETVTELVAGQQRTVNLLNNTITTTTTSNYGSSTSTVSIRFYYDQQTGIFVKLVFAFSITGSFGSSESELTMGMTDNNIWRTSVYPDFNLNTSPSTVNAAQASHANSTITISRNNGFSATVKLTTTSSSNSLTCILSTSKLANGGPDNSILSCNGPPGSYTVTITGDSGYTTHTSKVTINIANPTLLDYVQTPAGYGGIAAAGIIIALLALVFTRRKRAPQPTLGPSDTPIPPPTTGPADTPP